MGEGADQGGETRDRARGRVAVIGGDGALPAAALRALRDAGDEAIAFGFAGIGEASDVRPENRLPLGALGALRQRLRAEHVTRVVLVGGFSLAWLVDGSGPPIEPDAEALALLATLDRSDGAGLMGAVADWLDAQGFALLAQDEAMPRLVARTGQLGHVAPPAGVEESVHAALEALAALARGADAPRSLAQSVAMRGKEVVAVEGEAGTDALIREAGGGALIVKAARPGQDRRLDLPTVGSATIAAMESAGASTLAVEAGSVLIVDRGEVAARADACGIALLGFPGGAR